MQLLAKEAGTIPEERREDGPTSGRIRRHARGFIIVVAASPASRRWVRTPTTTFGNVSLQNCRKFGFPGRSPRLRD